jgi:lipopolysaccharide export system protein LptA
MFGAGIQLKKISQILFLISAATLSGSFSALDSDKEQDVLYSGGDSSSRSVGNLRIISIQDNVKVAQGSLQLTGNSAVFEQNTETGDMRRISVSGSPARYQQQLDDTGALIEGDGEEILYYFEDEPIIEFVGSANLRQQNDTLSCVAIKYFIDSAYTEYKGPCTGVLGR